MKLLKLIVVFLAATLASSSISLALEPCPSDVNVLWSNCFGTLTLEDDSYVGEFKDDKFHGQGTYTFADGDRYVGEFISIKLEEVES